MDRVGVIGLGLMGGELAGRFLAGGLRVVGYDPRAECRQRLVERGGEAVTSVREVFAAARVVVLSLPTNDVVQAVLAEAGDLLPRARIIDTTTGDPDATADLGRRLAAAGTGYLDATLIGSSKVAGEGQLVVTAGGTDDEFRHAEPVFRHFAKQWFHVGPWGSGARTKLVVNLVLGLNRAVLAEALAFAKRCDLDPAAMLEVLRSGVAYSRVMDIKGQKMLAGDFTPEAKLAQHHKDVRLILDAGAKAGAVLPLSERHERLLAELVDQGLGECDNSCVIRAFDGERGTP